MIIGCDGAGEMDEFGPDSWWAYIYDNPQDDEAYAHLQKMFEEADPVEPDPADSWKNGNEE